MAHQDRSYSADRPPDLLTVEEVAARLKEHHRTTRRRIASGQIEAVKLGTSPQSPIRVPADALEAWLFSNPLDEGEA